MKTKMLILLMAVVVAGWFAGCAEKPPEETPEETPQATPEVTCPPCPEPTPCPEYPELPAATVDCSACHTKATEYVDHVNGGKYCFNCHGSDPHVIHTGEGTVNLECAVCHGTGAEFRTGEDFRQEAVEMPAGSTCELCHDPTDPVQPSFGNLVNIHIEREIPCSGCHPNLSTDHDTANAGAQGTQE